MGNNPVPLKRRMRVFFLMTLWSIALGPLIGGAPFNWTIIAIPYSYMFGGIPALFGGVMFASLVTVYGHRWRFTRMRRLQWGAISGALGCAITTLTPIGFGGFTLAIFGAPAGAFCALLYKQAWIEHPIYGLGSPSPEHPEATRRDAAAGV